MQFFYGKGDTYINITITVLSNFLIDNKVTIYGNDVERFFLFKIDPLPGIIKNIKVIDKYGNIIIFDEDQNIIDLNFSEDFNFDNLHPHKKYIFNKIHEIENPEIRLTEIQKLLKINNGDFTLEYPEQLMVTKFLSNNRKVLELGSNIGRNSLIISTILSDDRNLVTLECNSIIFQQLLENKELNNLNFQCENSALSKRKLKMDGWKSNLTDEDSVNIIDYETLKKKYNIEFNTLVCDCEGSLFQLILDMPEILQDISLIICENDFFNDIQHNFVLNRFRDNGFKCIYTEDGIYEGEIFYKNFYQVWMK